MPAPVVAGAAAAGGKSGLLKAAALSGGSGTNGRGGKGGVGCLAVAAVAMLLTVAAVAIPLVVLTVVLGGAEGGKQAAPAVRSEVPGEFLPTLMMAAGACEEVSAPLLAAQIEVESGWDPLAQSWAGAVGLAQFMPATWNQWGRDGDGDALAEIANGHDSIASQVAYMCDLMQRAEAGIASGTLAGDPASIALAAYNAGWSTVVASAGVPSISQEYVTQVLTAMTGYTWLGPTAGIGGAASGNAIVDAAMTWVGYPYVWGGGTINGPSKIGSDGRGPGFDCSGLVLNAVYAATGMQLNHLADSQARDDRGITVIRDFSQMQPGDIVAFSNSGGRRYQHVGIYVGDGQMVHAPTTGKNVQVVDLENNRYYGAMVWSIRRFA